MGTARRRGQLQGLHAAKTVDVSAELRRLAHGLRGSALYLGAQRLAKRCEELEDAVDQGLTDPGPKVEAIEAIEEAFDQVKDALNR